MRRLRALILLGMIAAAPAAAFVSAASAAAQGASTVLVTEVRGPITPVIADHLSDGVRRAEAGGHAAYLVQVDTPGGLDSSMRQIVQSFLNARVPVLVHVAPAGARAASAGAIIASAAHVVGMAPGTTIGAATPVDLQGGEISDKVINDAAAYAVSVAKARGRNVEFAEEIVRKGRAVGADEAVEVGAADMIAAERATFLDMAAGRVVQTAADPETTIETSAASGQVAFDLGLFPRILQWLADPNLAFLFLSIGTLAVVYEVANPGIGAGGITGAIMIVLAMFALSVLPVNVAGVALIVLAAALFLAELFVPGVGVMAAGGTVSLLLGGVFLFRGEVAVSPGVLLPIGVLVGGGVIVAGRLAWRSRTLRTSIGPESLVGSTCEVKRWSGRHGQVFAQGTWWSATSDQELSPGDVVGIEAVDGLTLRVATTGATDGGMRPGTPGDQEETP